MVSIEYKFWILIVIKRHQMTNNNKIQRVAARILPVRRLIGLSWRGSVRMSVCVIYCLAARCRCCHHSHFYIIYISVLCWNLWTVLTMRERDWIFEWHSYMWPEQISSLEMTQVGGVICWFYSSGKLRRV